MEAAKEQRSYDAFGQVQTTADLNQTPVKAGYTGHELDAELGLINMKGRIYDPFSRRFMTPDPFVTEPFHPQGLNRYAYVKNNPMNFVDPSGFDPEMGPVSEGGGDQGGGSGPTGQGSAQSGGEPFGGLSEICCITGYFGDGGQSGYGNGAGDTRSTAPDYSPGDTQFMGAGPAYSPAAYFAAPAQPGGFCGPGGDWQAAANANPSAAPAAINVAGSTSSSTSNGTASPAPATLSDFGPWQGLAQMQQLNSTAAMGPGNGYVRVATGATLGAAALIPAGAAMITGGLGTAPAAVPGGVMFVGGALKFVGGAASGMTSAALQGRSATQIGQQGLINGVVSIVNPAGLITSSPVWSGAINSMTANGINQLASTGEIDPRSVLVAGVARGMFGYMWVGSAASTFSDYAAQGMVSGVFSGSAGILMSATAGM